MWVFNPSQREQQKYQQKSKHIQEPSKSKHIQTPLRRIFLSLPMNRSKKPRFSRNGAWVAVWGWAKVVRVVGKTWENTAFLMPPVLLCAILLTHMSSLHQLSLPHHPTRPHTYRPLTVNFTFRPLLFRVGTDSGWSAGTRRRGSASRTSGSSR